MLKYTTGEVAKLSGVSVRTVQYYDTRGILCPSELSEGGRRMYTQQDVNRMKIICFLRDAGLPLKSIGQLLSDENPGEVIGALLEQQRKELEQEQAECGKKLEILEGIDRSLKTVEEFTVESIGDIACILKSSAEMKRVRGVILVVGTLFGIMEWTSILLWVLQKIWWPFVIYTLLAVPGTVWLFIYYCRKVAFVCPHCHRVFRPAFKEIFFAKHTMTARRLTCTCCGHTGFCIETYARPDEGQQ